MVSVVEGPGNRHRSGSLREHRDRGRRLGHRGVRRHLVPLRLRRPPPSGHPQDRGVRPAVGPGRPGLAARAGQRGAARPRHHRPPRRGAPGPGRPRPLPRLRSRALPTTTLPALACAHAANRHGTATGEAVSLALREALFEAGLDISRAPGAGRDRRTVWRGPAGPPRRGWRARRLARGNGAGRQGLTTLLLRGPDAFCPSLDISRDGQGHLTVKPDFEALDAFLKGCVGA